MNKPIFSVLMPVYNGERFLQEAIESVLNQTFADFEFLIIDDGSIDNTAQIIHSYTDKRIRYVKNEVNLGISKSLNKGIELAKADLIARMDSDDISYPDRLQKQYDFINTHPDGALYTCYAKEVNEQGDFLTVNYFKPEHLFHSITFSVWIYHPTMVYRKSAVKSFGKYTVPYAEDVELTWQLSRRYKVYLLPEVLLDYRITGNSLWQVTKKEEYHQAFVNQIRRNILFYLEDPTATIEDWKIEILSYCFEPGSLHHYSVSQILECLALLNLVTEKMTEKSNPNMDPNALYAANEEKKDFIINLFLPVLPYYNALLLLLKSGRGDKIPQFLHHKTRNVIKKSFK